MMFKVVCVLAYFSALSAATPFALEGRALPSCAAVPTVNNRLSRCATATKFCQSFIRSSTTRPVVVTTSTSTITRRITATTRPRTTEVTTTVVETSPTSTVSTSTSTATDTATCPAIAVQTNAAPSKRDLSLEARAPDPKPSCGVRDQPIRDVQAGCSCLLFPTSTLRARTTTRTTVTTTTITSTIRTGTTTTTTPLTTASTVDNTGACPTPVTECNNQGLNWSYKRYNYDHGDAAFYYEVEPEATGTTPDLGDFKSGTSSFYESQQSPEGFWFEHTTYIFAPQTGTYTFKFVDLDDNGLLWVGDKAYNSFTNDNADIAINTVDINTPRATFQTVLEQGTYTAFRLVWVQGQSVGYLHFEVTAPNGELIMSSYDNGATTPAYLVTSSCDGTTAPAFPPFNNEGSPATSVCDDTCTCPALQQRFVTRVSNVIVDRQVCDADCPKCQDQFCPTNCLCLRRQGSAEDKLGRRLEVTTREVCDSDCPACQDDEGDESGDEGDDEVCDDTCTCPADGEDTRRSLARRVFLEPVTCSPTCAKCNDPAPVCSNCVCPGTPDAVLGFALVCDATCSQCTNTGGNESDDEDGEGEGSNEETCTNGERYIPTNTPTPRAFNIMCDTALVGTASGTTTAPDLHSCINACELTQGCTAVAFLKLQNVPDNCAFYGDGSQYVPTAVVDIAFADGHQPPRYTGPA